MPDAYETARCGSVTCLASSTLVNGYTNLERYLAGL
jgi:hypothetical protein